MIIEFKRLFGLNGVPFKWSLLGAQLSHSTYRAKVDGVEYAIRIGSFGRSVEERRLLERSGSYDESWSLGVPTLDVVFRSKLEDLPTHSLEEKLKQFRPQAYRALACFIQAWMQVEKQRHRDGPSEDETLALIRRIPRISLAEFQTYLFYRTRTATKTRVGLLGEGETIITQRIQAATKRKIKTQIESDRVPSDQQLLEAWLNYYDEDYTTALLNAAFASEIITKHFLVKQLIRSGIRRKSADGFVRWLPMQHAFQALLPLYARKEDHGFFGGCVKIFRDRNNIVHKGKSVGKKEARYAILCAEKLSRLLH
jgi:hypothetical protein